MRKYRKNFISIFMNLLGFTCFQYAHIIMHFKNDLFEATDNGNITLRLILIDAGIREREFSADALQPPEYFRIARFKTRDKRATVISLARARVYRRF